MEGVRTVIAISLAALLLAPATASAVTRYAAPGGTATASECVTPEAPRCALYVAAGDEAGSPVTAGDEVIVTPGGYSDTAGDLGENDSVAIVNGVDLHGQAGAARPVIVQNNANTLGALQLNGSGTRVAGVEISTDITRTSLDVRAGVAEDVIVRSSSSTSQTIVCVHHAGVLRDSACIATGAGATALGASLGTFPQTTTLTVRNVTALATGTSSVGISYGFFGAGVNFTVDVKNTIAQGAAQDARAVAGNDATVAVNLEHSNFDTSTTQVVTSGTPSITPPGAGAPLDNVTEAPMLAGDGIHQVGGSPTIDAGTPATLTGAFDIDGQDRAIDAAPDIGADELGHATATAIDCGAGTVETGQPVQCAVTVTDTAPAPITPAGTIAVRSDAAGAFSTPSCALAPIQAGVAGCGVTYTPGEPGSHGIAAALPSGGAHEASTGSTSLLVSAPITDPVTDPPTTDPRPKPAKRCKKGFKLKKVKPKKKGKKPRKKCVRVKKKRKR